MAGRKCSGCGNPLDAHNEGIDLWGSSFCSTCFITHSSKLNRELTADDIALLKTIGRELSGFLPPDVLEMVLAGFYRRATGKEEPAPAAEMARCVGEIQRLAAFSTFRKVLNLLKTWQDTFNEFVESQEADVRESVKKLTDLEQ